MLRLTVNGEGIYFFLLLVQESKMIVSVTGATGFVGKRLVQRLHAGIPTTSSLQRF